MLAAFLLVFVAEIGDKTQLVAFSLASSSGKPWRIFAASSLALISSTILASLLGMAASELVPFIASLVSAGLFIGSGVYILTAKEPPLVKKGFLEAVLLEEWVIKTMEKVFRNAGKFDIEIMSLLNQEKGHTAIFKYLVKEKRFFKDDINEDEGFKAVREQLDMDTDLRGADFQTALDKIVKAEKACVDFYRYLHEHLQKPHHEESRLEKVLADILREEEQHIQLLELYAERSGDEG